jgi:hypothetical protein
VALGVAVVLIASSMYVFKETKTLKKLVNNVDCGRGQLQELIYDNPREEQLRHEIREIQKIIDEMDSPDEVYETAIHLHETLEITPPGYFGQALDHISLDEVNAIKTAGLEMRQAIPEFLSTLNSMVNILIYDFTNIPEVSR